MTLLNIYYSFFVAIAVVVDSVFALYDALNHCAQQLRYGLSVTINNIFHYNRFGCALQHTNSIRYTYTDYSLAKHPIECNAPFLWRSSPANKLGLCILCHRMKCRTGFECFCFSSMMIALNERIRDCTIYARAM